MTTHDAEIDACQALDTFIEQIGDGHQTPAATQRALIELAARALLGACAIIFMRDPASQDCPECAALALAAQRAHEINLAGEPTKH